ncbi:MAG: hypothetical protein DI547_02080 [Sphingobium sp.]|nr:MAG: hypothetical protein DI547_02080 [Sphingobium sp.]
MKKGLLLFASSLAISGAASAQEAATPPAPAQQAGDEAATQPKTGDIVVTGSRLSASGYTAPSPTTVIGKDAIEQRAPAQVSDLTDRLPSVRLSSGAQQSQRFFNTGAAPIDLRGFGPGRTLTLVDGNRFASGTVDSNLIPVNLIERVDIVTGGASAAYGSDAVAGVVNFVLRKRIEGFRASVQSGFSEEGDASERVFNLAFGSAFAGGRGHFVVGFDYADNDGVPAIGSRDWGQRNPYLVSNGLTRAAGVPAQSFATDVTYSRQSTGGLVFSGPLAGTAFGPGGVPYRFQYGQVLTSLMIGGENEQGNPNGNAPLLTPTSRRVGLVRAEYALTPDLTVFAEGNYGYTKTDSYTGFYQGTAIIGIDNPYLPAATRAAMQSAGVSTVTVGRLLADYGGSRNYSTHETVRALVGLEGKLLDSFTWDVTAQYSQTDNLGQVKDVLVGNFLAAVNAVTGPDGKPACGPVLTNPNLTDATRRAQVQPGCVPLNIFGLGSPSDAALDYVTGHGGSVSSSLNQLWNGAVNLRGSPFSTWAGPVQIAIGGEWRKEAIDTRANALSLQSAWNASNGGQYSGSFNVKEAYTEVGLPLAAGLPFANALDLNGAFRITDYSTSGVVHTWKVGGTWEPVEGLRLRTTRSRDIRAPTLANLYAFGGPGGCCNITNPFNGENGRLSTAATGNPKLQPEIADTVTAGVVLAPKWAWARWFRASVDYYQIKLKDAITTVNGVDIINRCAQGQQEYCEAIVFDNSTFGIAYVRQQPFNLNRLLRRGVDLSTDMNFDLSDRTKLEVTARATRAIAVRTYDRGTVIERAGSIQGDGVPKWAGTLDVSLRNGPFRTTVSARYFSQSKFDATMVGPEDEGYAPTLANSLDTNRAPARTYFDLYTEYTLRAGNTAFTLFGQVQNLLDKDPWLYASTSITSGGNPYDLIGRRFRVGVRVNR